MSNLIPLAYSRRRLLREGGLFAGCLGMPALLGRAVAQPAPTLPGGLAIPTLPPPPLRTDGVLPNPDLTLLRSRVARSRPHRKGGVRLELDPEPLAAASGPKYIIHNYGHSGAGITLSWGCAAATVSLCEDVIERLKQAGRQPRVAVIGTGVVGLTVATELRARWRQLPVTIYAKNLDVRATTSYAAGGQFEPSIIMREYQASADLERVRGWLRQSYQRIKGIQLSGNREKFGVAERLNYTLDHQSSGFQALVDAGIIDAPATGLLPFSSLKQQPGRAYKTFLMNPTILLPRLVADLRERDVRFRTKVFVSREQIANELGENIIINCTGLGAKALCPDDTLDGQHRLQGKRGHLVILRKNNPRQFYFLSGGCSDEEISYVFCRQNDIVIGGSVVNASDDTDDETFSENDRALCDNVQAKAEAFLAGNLDLCNSLMQKSHALWPQR